MAQFPRVLPRGRYYFFEMELINHMKPKVSALIQFGDTTTVLELPQRVTELRSALLSAGIRESPACILLTDNDGDALRVKLYPHHRRRNTRSARQNSDGSYLSVKALQGKNFHSVIILMNRSTLLKLFSSSVFSRSHSFPHRVSLVPKGSKNSVGVMPK